MSKICKKNSVGKQFKSFSIDKKELNVDSQSRKISGYAAIWGNRDKAADILIKGCCAKSIQERGPQSSANDKIIFLWMHDMHEPVGKITTLYEDDKGLYFEAEIDEIEIGDRIIKQLESGTLNQFSIGFNYVWDKVEYDDKTDSYIVKEIILWELSVVSIGMNGLTEYTGLKSAEEIQDKELELQKEIDSELNGLSASKKSAIQGLFSRVSTLSKIKPDEARKKELVDTLDESGAGRTSGSLFSVKFINKN